MVVPGVALFNGGMTDQTSLSGLDGVYAMKVLCFECSFSITVQQP